MHRMNGLDASFYLLEDENTPLHIASVIVLEGPPPGYGDLVRAIAARLHQIPRYRQRVRPVPLHLGLPVWADDPHFQILYHIRHTALPAPGEDEQLRNLAGRVLAQRLDPDKPLWEVWLVEGLSGDRWAIIAKVHHCMVDGLAGMELANVLFDLSADYRPPADPEPWRPERPPSTAGLLAGGVWHGLLQPARQLSALPGVVGSLRDPARVRDFTTGLARATARFLRPSVGSLNGPICPHRRWCWTSGDLAEVKEIRRALGGTVNDVVLTAVARGFREHLAARGELTADSVVRTAVPHSLRSPAEQSALTNRLAAVFVNLPVGVEDPVRRLALIREQMDDLKHSRQHAGMQAIFRLTDSAGAPVLLKMAARTPLRMFNPAVQTVTTNVPGPQFPLYMLGRRVLEMHPYVPLTAGVRVVTAIISYCGTLHFGITGDFNGVPDLELVTKGIRAGFDELLEAAGAPPGKPVDNGSVSVPAQE